MNCIIPFTKDIKFKTNICEILSISLEHDYTLNETELLGNFIITGDYKSHEVSVNKEHFEHVLPFSVSLVSPIKEDTLDFNIEDFTYQILDDNTLKVDIEYAVKGEELERTEKPLVFEDIESEDDAIEDLLEEFDEKDEEVEEEIREEEVRSDNKEVEERAVTETEKETIINEINKDDNTFVTYHIHIMKENETIETVCTMYNTSTQTIGEYNDISNIAIGDKIIIPDIDE